MTSEAPAPGIWTVPDSGALIGVDFAGTPEGPAVPASAFSVNKLLGYDRSEHRTTELADALEVTTGWVGGVRCIETLVPTPGGFVPRLSPAAIEREYLKACQIPAALFGPGDHVTATENAARR